MISFWLEKFRRQTWHPSFEDLMLYLDGELGSNAARVQDHAKRCWSCRVRLEKVNQAISEFMEVRSASLMDSPNLPRRASLNFDDKLARLEVDTKCHNFPSDLMRKSVRALFDLQVTARSVVLVALIGLLLAVVFRLTLTPPVSASEVLYRARQAEIRQVARVASPVIYQKLQLSRHSGSHLDTVTWEIWDDTQNQRLRQRAKSNGKGVAHATAIPSTQAAAEARPVGDLVEIFRRHHADLGRPLCAANYETWRAAIPQVSEKVSEGQLPSGEKATILEATGQGFAPPDSIGADDGATRPADGQVSTAATASVRPQASPSVKLGFIANEPATHQKDKNEGPQPLAAAPSANLPAGEIPPAPESHFNRILKAELVVRSADWHPVEERLWVDDREYKIAELDYKVIPLSEVDALVFAPPAVPLERVEAPHPALIETAETLVPPPPHPEETEMAVRYALHQLKADLGEPIDISLGSEGNVIVDASALAPELQAKLKEQLAGIPNAGLVLKRPPPPPCEGCAVPVPALPESSLVASVPALRIIPAVNPNEKRLEEIFGDPHAQESFTQEVLDVSGSGLSHGFALRALALRYTPGEEAELTPAARAELEKMVSDHIAALTEKTNRLQGLLRPLLEALSNGRATGVPEAAAPRPPGPGDATGAPLTVPPPDIAPQGRRPDQVEGKVTVGPEIPSHADSQPSIFQWQNAGLEVFATVQKADRLVKDLLTNTDTALPAAEAVPELRQVLSEQQQALSQYQDRLQQTSKLASP